MNGMYMKSTAGKTGVPVFIVFFLAILFSCKEKPGAGNAREMEFTYINSLDSTTQTAVAYVPEKSSGKASPLLVVAHYLGGDRFSARNLGYYSECDKRGWLLVCPELHGTRTGGKMALASLESQHDIIDAIRFMKERYMVDTTMIYIAGRSMGGMTAQIMAAKYPDVFAAAVAGQGISDLRAWIEESPRFREPVESECGIFDTETSFDYSRRSSMNYGPNFTYVPLILWHGTNDFWVIPRQSEALHDSIARYTRYKYPIEWFIGAPHCRGNLTPEWICDRLMYFQNVCEAGQGVGTRFYDRLRLVTDEDKSFFWLTLYRQDTNDFGGIDAAVRSDSLLLTSRNLKRIVIDLDKLARDVSFSRYRVVSDCQATVVVMAGAVQKENISVQGEKSGNIILQQ